MGTCSDGGMLGSTSADIFLRPALCDEVFKSSTLSSQLCSVLATDGLSSKPWLAMLGLETQTKN